MKAGEFTISTENQTPGRDNKVGRTDTVTTIVHLEPEYAQTVLGISDANLRVVENLLGAAIHVRGTKVTINGTQAQTAVAIRVFRELQSMAKRGHELSRESVTRLVSMVSVEAPQSVAQQLAGEIIRRRGKVVRPKTAGQADYVEAIDDNTIIFGIGPAGTGKTYLAVAKAVQALQNKEVERIILSRPAVEAGENLGFLPGTLHEKIDPYLRPLHDALRDMMDPEKIPKLMEAGVIEVAPLAYMRGRTLNNAFVILDEAQNTTPAQMKMFLTRLGFGTKMVVTGDISQVDLPGGKKSGLRVVRHILDGIDGVHFADLGSADVVRHNLVSAIVDAYDRHDKETERRNSRDANKKPKKGSK